jgi:hypothetical protein
MKIKQFLALTALALLLCGCTAEPAGVQPDSSTGSRQAGEWFDVYQTTGEDPAFTQAVHANEIDQDYNREFYEEAGTTQEFVVVQKKYLEIWKAELADSAGKFAALLTDADRAEFLRVQKAWETENESRLQFEQGILLSGEYGLDLGSDISYLWLSEVRESYRRRTIRVKYLHYLLETAGGAPASYEECRSLQFAYQG